MKRPRPYNDPVALDIAPTPKGNPANATSDMHRAVANALHEVGTSLIQAHDDGPATMAGVGFAFRHAADKIRATTPERGPAGPKSTGGLLGTPAPDQEAT